jgi:single-stranded DNA-binding protein
MTEYKKRDTSDKYEMCGARLTKDAEARDTEYGKMVRLSFASESRREAHTTLWVEANVQKFQTEIAAFLKKGDILHQVRGKPALRIWGDNNDKFSFICDNAELVIPHALFVELKARGFEPGAKTEPAPVAGKKSAPVAGKKPAPATKPVKKAPPPIEIPDDDELDIEDDE